MLAAAGVFVGTYVLLSLPRVEVRGVRITRPVLALAGGALMLAVGAVAPAAALHAVDVPTLLLLLGMMLLVAALDVAGFFALVAEALVRRAPSPTALLVATMLVVAVLSALVLNDAVVLLFTPILVRATARLRLDPMPYLAGEAVAANVGSLATPVGNPQNAFVALAGGVEFARFVAALLPVAAVSLAVAVALALVVFRRALAAAPRAAVAEPPPPRPTPLLAALLVLVAAVVALFFLSGRLGLRLHEIALLGGLAAFLLAEGGLLAAGRARGSRLLPPAVPRRVNWGVLALFAGLFVLLAGVRESGLLATFLSAMGGLRLDTVAGLSVVSAVLSNLVSNVPAVMLLAAVATGETAWLALAASSTLAGNATLLGAAANVIVAEEARANGVAFDVWRFVAFGLPVALVTVAFAAWWLG